MQPLYKIKLQNFEGPLDLLLFFVRKDELNIYDIPLARITKSYLEYLQLMQDLDLDIAGEFILMAATLMRIKAKSMLPPDPTEEEDEDMMDPREELSRRLIEYRQFKEASKTLSELDEYWRTVYRRSYFNFDLLPPNQDEAVGLKDVSFFDLLTAYKNALAKRPKMIFHNIERMNVTVEDQRKYIMDFFRDRTCYLFTELCEDMGKIEIVVTFLAMLELIRQGEIAAKQASIFDDIWIYKAEEFKEEEIPEGERAVSAEAIQAEIQDMIDTQPETETETAAEAVDESLKSKNLEEESNVEAAAADEENLRTETAEAETIPGIVAADELENSTSFDRHSGSGGPNPVDTQRAGNTETIGNDAVSEEMDTRNEIAETETKDTNDLMTVSPEPNAVTEPELLLKNEAVADLKTREKKSEDSKKQEGAAVETAVAHLEPVRQTKEKKVSLMRNFFNKLVSVVKKLFS